MAAYVKAKATSDSGDKYYKITVVRDTEDVAAVVAINAAKNSTEMEDAISANATILELELTDYNTLTNKGPVHSALIDKNFEDKAAVKTAFDAAVSTQKLAEAVLADKTLIEAGIYEIPLANQDTQEAKTAWVQSAVNLLIANETTATVTWNTETNKYDVALVKGAVNNTASITVTEEAADSTPITAIAAISGTAKVDVELTAGALTPAGAIASYKWMICDTVDGTYVDIASATTNKYTPVAGDVGKFIKVVATGSGDYTGEVTSAATAAVASEFAAGSGTEVDPYQVSSAAELNNVRKHLGANTYFTQTANIILSGWSTGEGWNPIGDNTKPFNGTYDGNSMTITGLVIDRAGSDYQGLFGKISKDATIKNCSVSGSVTGKDNVGGLVGSNDGGTISSCYAPSVSITGNDNVGGLVGFVSSSSGALATIEKSYASGSVKGVSKVGGLVGLNSMQGENIVGSIKNSYTDVSVDAMGSYVGGLIGNNTVSHMTVETSIENCYSKGSVKSSLEGQVYIGGLVGGNNNNIKNSYAVGKVIVTNGEDGYIGGLIGRLTGGGIVTSSYYDSITTGQSDTGKGDGKTTADMKQEATFEGWDFGTIWTIVEDSSYPTLK